MEFLLTMFLIIIFILGLYLLLKLKTKFKKTFNFRVLSALVLGLIFGGIIQVVFGFDSNITTEFTTFTNIVSGIYVNLLKLIVIPLIFVSITMAIIDSGENAKIGKKISQIIGVLLFTVTIAATIGILIVSAFNIDANKIMESSIGNEETINKAESLTDKKESLEDMTYADYILAPIPTDFSFLVGAGSTAALTTVLFGGFLGYSTVQIRKRKEEKSRAFIEFLRSLKEVILSMVREILKLTPFGIFALMTKFMATSSLDSLGELTKFLIATYIAILLMYFVHLIIISLQGISPIKYVKKTWSVLVFGFGSRSSMATIPLNVQTQKEQLGVDDTTANLSATLGATIGQNGCAGIYPAMVAIMAAQIVGLEITPIWILTLIVVIVISSFGIAGVGGGATFAAIAVLTIMGLPVEIAALLIGIEPLLDMARTVLNISDSMVAGVTVANINKTLDKKEINK